jgi:serine/threonine protein phosphatase PrpC
MSLTTHPDGYNLSYSDLKNCINTFFSAKPYADRHMEMASQSSPHSLTHRRIAYLEYIPVIGAFAALIERIVVYAYNRFKSNSLTDLPSPASLSSSTSSASRPVSSSSSASLSVSTSSSSSSASPPKEQEPTTLKCPKNATWVPRHLTVEQARPKMEKNMAKAIVQHWDLDPSVYLSPTENISLTSESLKAPLKFSFSAHSHIGHREKMEDFFFHLEMPEGVVAGVLDGHSGAEVAKFAAAAFKERFHEALKRAKYNVHDTFETLIDEVQTEILKKDEWKKMGSAVVISFLDKTTGLVYTATVGDCEANIYWKVNGTLKSIPLSVIMNWGREKEAIRNAYALSDLPPESAIQSSQLLGFVKAWLEKAKHAKDPKKVRSFIGNNGLNTSRAIGDKDCLPEDPKSTKAIIHKPKITITKAHPGDIVVLCSDGLKDSLEEKEIVQFIAQSNNFDALAQELVEKACKSPKNSDNITVIAIQLN